VEDGYSDGQIYVRGVLGATAVHVWARCSGEPKQTAIQLYRAFTIPQTLLRRARGVKMPPDGTHELPYLVNRGITAEPQCMASEIAWGTRTWKQITGKVGRWKLNVIDTLNPDDIRLSTAESGSPLTDLEFLAFVQSVEKPDNKLCYGYFTEDFCEACDDYSFEINAAKVTLDDVAAWNFQLDDGYTPIPDGEASLRRVGEETAAPYGGVKEFLAAQGSHPWFERAGFGLYGGMVGGFELWLGGIGGNIQGAYDYPATWAQTGQVNLSWNNPYPAYEAREYAPEEQGWKVKTWGYRVRLFASFQGNGYQVGLGYIPIVSNYRPTHPEDYVLKSGNDGGASNNGVAWPFIPDPSDTVFGVDLAQMVHVLPVYNGDKSDVLPATSSAASINLFADPLPSKVPVNEIGGSWAIGAEITLEAVLVYALGPVQCHTNIARPGVRKYLLCRSSSPDNPNLNADPGGTFPYETYPWDSGFFDASVTSTTPTPIYGDPPFIGWSSEGKSLEEIMILNGYMIFAYGFLPYIFKLLDGAHYTATVAFINAIKNGETPTLESDGDGLIFPFPIITSFDTFGIIPHWGHTVYGDAPITGYR